MNFLRSTKNGTWIELGYPAESSAYCMSKIGLNALTEIQQNDFDQDTSREGIIVSSVTPGFCKTDLTRGQGIYTAEEGKITLGFK